MLFCKLKFIKDFRYLIAFGNTLNSVVLFNSSLNNVLFVNSVVDIISPNINFLKINIVKCSYTFQKSSLHITEGNFIFLEE